MMMKSADVEAKMSNEDMPISMLTPVVISTEIKMFKRDSFIYCSGEGITFA